MPLRTYIIHKLRRPPFAAPACWPPPRWREIRSSKSETHSNFKQTDRQAPCRACSPSRHMVTPCYGIVRRLCRFHGFRMTCSALIAELCGYLLRNGTWRTVFGDPTAPARKEHHRDGTARRSITHEATSTIAISDPAMQIKQPVQSFMDRHSLVSPEATFFHSAFDFG